MNKIKRPLSPHLQVYKPQLTSMLSIMHRITGLVLSLGLVVFVYWLYQLATDINMANGVMAFFQSTLGQIIMFTWFFTFFYHLCNGIRHLFWDVGKGYSIPIVYRSGYLVLTTATLLTLLVYFLSR